MKRNLTTSVLYGTAHLSFSLAFLFSAILWSLGNCAGTPYTCSDCKSCDGLGGCELSANICNIGGSCYPSFSDFKYNPSNACEGKSGGCLADVCLFIFWCDREIVSPRNPFFDVPCVKSIANFQLFFHVVSFPVVISLRR